MFRAIPEASGRAFSKGGLQFRKDIRVVAFPRRMTHHFNEVGWPSQIPTDEQGRKDFIAGMHKQKTEIFMKMVESGGLPLREGVAR